MTLREMREKLKGLVAANRALLKAAEDAGQADLSEADAATFEANTAEIEKLKASIGRHEATEANEATLAERRPAAARGQEGGQTRAPGDAAATTFEHFGQFLFAVRFNQNDPRLANLYREGDPDGQSAFLGTFDGQQFSAEQRMDTGSSGGFMVPQQFRSEILKIDPATSIIRPRARVIPAGSPPDAIITMPALDQTGAQPGNMFGGVQVDWIAEGQEKPETDAKLREIKLEPHEVAGHVVVTDKLLRNWQAAGPFVQGLLRDAITQAEDFAFIAGNGIGKPLGYLNSPATLPVPRQQANRILYADLVNMVAVVLMRGGSPVWVGSQSIIPQLLNMRDDDGRLIFAMAPADGLGPRLLGYPFVINNRFAGLGNKGDLSIADFSNYLIKDGSGPFIATSEHVLFRQNKTVIKAFWNVDGQPWLSAPFTEENGYEVSPFVVLDVPG